MEILHIRNLNFTYPKSDKKAVSDVSFCVNKGEFIVICGTSGSGKSTLLKLLKKELAPIGDKSGEILFCGKPLDKIDLRQSASEIGFVDQNPDNRIITDKVWHELSFGLENLGVDSQLIRRKTAETAEFFNITGWFRQDTSQLSGGQKQLLNLASVMIMEPQILILDEPTSQLDPIAAEEFITALKKLNSEFGTTIIITEHRLENVLPAADKVAVMENGEIKAFDAPEKIGVMMKNNPVSQGFPVAMRVFQQLNLEGKCPLTVKDGRNLLDKHFSHIKNKKAFHSYKISEQAAIEAKNIWFRYEKNSTDILRGINLTIHKNEIFSILGSTGAGKTTLLNVISGLERPYRGGVKISGKKIKDYKNNSLYRRNLSMLHQNPLSMFTKDSVLEDFEYLLKSSDNAKDNIDNQINMISKRLDISHLLNKHPYDLSGGEQQKCALGKLLLSQPQIILLDEPTKGIDAYAKRELVSLLKELKNSGAATLIVTHDIEFAAQVSDKCALFFDGEILSADDTDKFFSGNNYYTTSAYQMSRSIFKNAILCEDIISLCKEQNKL